MNLRYVYPNAHAIANRGTRQARIMRSIIATVINHGPIQGWPPPFRKKRATGRHQSWTRPTPGHPWPPGELLHSACRWSSTDSDLNAKRRGKKEVDKEDKHCTHFSRARRTHNPRPSNTPDCVVCANLCAEQSPPPPSHLAAMTAGKKNIQTVNTF